MFVFDHVWIFFLLPAPLLLQRIMRAYQEHRPAVHTPFFDRLVQITGQTPAKGAAILARSRGQTLMSWTAWILILCAMARPQWIEDPIEKIESGRDLMLVVDLSGSMQTEDFTTPDSKKITRLDAVKLVLEDFIKRRKGDRLGLVIFANAAYLQSPFSQDHDTVRILLDQVQLGMAGVQTMLGDSIGLCIKLFEKSKSENKVVILLTDGNDTGSKMPPLKAARIAADKDIVIHTIAMGDPETAGEQALDMDTLKGISDRTNGRFYQALDMQQLSDIYNQLDKLEPREFDTLSYRPKKSLFQWPLGFLAVIILGYHMFMAAAAFIKKKTPISDLVSTIQEA